jgi:dihydropteroate synthase
VPISIDTTKADVALQALDAGASIVNDVSAMRLDARMARVVARARAAVILMHMVGTPQTMQRRARYRNVITEIAAFLASAATQAQAQGIKADRILIDPGLGFGKTPRHNLLILRHLEEFVSLGFPVVIGPSRKSFIGKALDVAISDRLPGTLACVAWALRCGVQMVRVHDVRQAAQLIHMLHAIEYAKPWR